jgi:hypothetical protein
MLTSIVPECEKLGTWNMLTIFNWSDERKSYELPVDEKIIGNLKGNRFVVFDFRKQEITGWFKKSDTLKISGISGHNSTVMKIVAWDGQSPMFLGTDLNFTCGGNDISEINYNDGHFSGIIDTEWILPVRLSFIVPDSEGYTLKQIVTVPGQKRSITGF